MAVKSDVPRYYSLIAPAHRAFLALGGSATNGELESRVSKDLMLADDVLDLLHKDTGNLTEFAYQLSWARTYMKKAGILQQSQRGVWVLTPEYNKDITLDGKKIALTIAKESRKKGGTSSLPDEPDKSNPDDTDYPEEDQPWRTKLAQILTAMDPYAFERLSQRLLRECGFTNVIVTSKSGDGGIDGTGKLMINGIFTFTVAFQCKRYNHPVGAPEIREFRGSMSTDIEKGVLITTDSFTKGARDEAVAPGKKQIDLIDGEEFINKLAQYGIGLKPVTSYEIDVEYFKNV